jgi:steroid delta-isomerase-like uncharacterized protein
MSVEEQGAVIRRWIEAWNAHDLDAADGLLSKDFVRHDDNMPEVLGPAAQRDFLCGVFRAFPDIHVEPEQLIAEGDLVAAHLAVTGTHRDDFLGIPATGRKMAIQSVDIFRLTDGKIVEQWVVMDALGLMRQLGAIPSPT